MTTPTKRQLGAAKGAVTRATNKGDEAAIAKAVAKLAALEGALAKLSAKEGQAATLRRYRPNYVKVQAASGELSMDTDDEVAKVLRGHDHDVVMAAAEELCGLKSGTLVELYALRNNGQKRMNAGNRIRGAFKRGEVTITEIAAALH